MSNSILKSAKLALILGVILCGFFFVMLPLATYATAIEEVEISFTVGAEHYVITRGNQSGYIHIPVARNRLTLNEGRPVAPRETIAMILGIRSRAAAQDAIFTRTDEQERSFPSNALLVEDIALFAGASSINWNSTTQTISFTIERALTPEESRRLNRTPFANASRERLTVPELVNQTNRAMPHIDNWNRSETPFPLLPDRRLRPDELTNWINLHNQWGITAREVAFVQRINEERARPHIIAEGLIICPYLSQLARFNVQSQLDIGNSAIVSNHPRYGETVSVEFGTIFGITTRGGRFTVGAITAEPAANFMTNMETSYRVIYNTLIAGRLRYIGVGSVNNVTYIILADANHSQNYS